MKEKKTVIFDMDGVLFDTERLCMDAWSVAAREQGIEGMEKVSILCIGQNANDTKALVLEHLGADFPYDAFRKRVSECVWEQLKQNGVPVKKGVRELLAYLKENGYQIGLASSSRREAVQYHLTDTNLTEYFSVTVTGDLVEHSKPLPDIYLLACEEMGVKPEAAYAIEDSPNGIRSAYAAGMMPIMVPDMVMPDDEMEQMSFRIFNDLSEVRKFFEAEEQAG